MNRDCPHCHASASCHSVAMSAEQEIALQPLGTLAALYRCRACLVDHVIKIFSTPLPTERPHPVAPVEIHREEPIEVCERCGDPPALAVVECLADPMGHHAWRRA